MNAASMNPDPRFARSSTRLSCGLEQPNHRNGNIDHGDS
jgi:hypothetical protein